jgi:hypothetical protein
VTISRQSTNFVCRIHPGQKGRVTILGGRLGPDIQFTLILISVVDRNDLLWLRFHFLLLKSFSSGSGSSSGSRLIQHSFSNKKKFVQNLVFSMLEAALFPRNLASTVILDFLLLQYILCSI